MEPPHGTPAPGASDRVDRARARSIWAGSFDHEAGFWDGVISGTDTRYAASFRERLSPARELAEPFRTMTGVPEGGTLRILDVGAGPCTVLGFAWPGRKVEITAVDPLAERYDALLVRAGLTPPVRTIKGEAERLSEQFPPGHFDIVFCHNALDHSYDPLGAIQQMLLVTRPGGCVRLEHAINEGEFERYTGLHQWNFCAQDGRFVIWNPATRIDVTQRLGSAVSMWCWANPDGRWLTVQINRPA